MRRSGQSRRLFAPTRWIQQHPAVGGPLVRSGIGGQILIRETCGVVRAPTCLRDHCASQLLEIRGREGEVRGGPAGSAPPGRLRRNIA